jgi:hypothetical protein
MKHAVLPFSAIVATLFAATLDAQRLCPAEFPGFRPRLSALQHADTAPKPEVRKRGDYTWEGVAIGGVVFGALGVSLSHMCGLSDQPGSCKGATLTGLLAGATVGVVLGGMIGSGIKKSSGP